MPARCRSGRDGRGDADVPWALVVVMVMAVFLSGVDDCTGALPLAEVTALEQFYRATGGEYWGGECAGWGDGDPCGDTAGVAGGSGYNGSVVCNADHSAVVELAVHRCNLTGPFPAAVCAFSRLKAFGAYGNRLRGSISPCICDLTELSALNVHSNELVGTIPTCVGRLNLTLTVLDLNTNQLTGPIPSGICELTRLAVLNLFSNTLVGGILPCLARLNHTLAELNVNTNHLSGTVPSALCHLTALSTLYLYSNQLTGEIPQCIGRLNRTLTELDLSINQLTGPISSGICDLTHLTKLNLYSNFLTGGIPRCLGQLNRTLMDLNINTNRLGGSIPNSICDLGALVRLFLFANDLLGTIPTCLGQLNRTLTVLDLDTNRLTGPIPSAICGLTALMSLYLNSNSLTGGIPRCIGQLNRTLTGIDLNSNHLTMPIPREVCDLSALVGVGLSNNPFSPGPIPECLCNIAALNVIQMARTQRTGPLPACLFDLPNVYNISASENQLSGAIPQSLCTATVLLVLDLASSGISGAIPSCIGHAVSLNTLRLDGLAPSGPLPPGLFTLPGLEVLVLSGAALRGGIPANIDFSQQIAYARIDLIRQIFVPARGFPLGRLRLLGLVGCGLSGPLPAWLGSRSLANLTTLAIGGNHFSGPLPRIVAGSRLQQLIAPDTGVDGTFEQLREATRLTHLDLSHNKLTGSLPWWLANRSAVMQELTATFNHLSCDLPANTAIAPGGAGVLRLLEGNLFGNAKLPSGVATADPRASSFHGGSQQLSVAGAAFGVALVMTGVLTVLLRNAGEGAVHYGRDLGTTTRQVQRLLAAAIFIVASILVLMLLPVYATANTVLVCRYGWATTAAFLQPWAGGSLRGMWVVGVATVGAIGLGGVVLPAVVVAGRPTHVRPELVTFGSAHTTESRRTSIRGQVAVTAGVLVVAAALVMINVAFVLLQESQSLSGASKTTVLVVFSLIHDGINHFAGPVLVSLLATVLKAPSSNVVITASTALVLTTSLVAPMVALLLASTGCFKDKFAPPVTDTSTIDVQYCEVSLRSGTGATATATCRQFQSYPVHTSFTQPFVFDGGRCVSSIIVLYTPEFLFIFAVRVLLYPMTWWLASKGVPWVVAGFRPAGVKLEAFYARQSRMLPGCGRSTASRRKAPSLSAQTPSLSDARVEDADDSGCTAERHHIQALRTLHAAEPMVQVYGLLAIAVCYGPLAPVVAVGACAVVGVLLAVTWALGEPISSGCTADDLSQAVADPNSPLETASMSSIPPERHPLDNPLPIVCIGLLLIVHTLYMVVLLSASAFAVGGWAASVISWTLFVGVCVWRRREQRRLADEGSTTDVRSDKGVAPAPAKLNHLTEPLLTLDSGGGWAETDSTL